MRFRGVGTWRLLAYRLCNASAVPRDAICRGGTSTWFSSPSLRQAFAAVADAAVFLHATFSDTAISLDVGQTSALRYTACAFPYAFCHQRTNAFFSPLPCVRRILTMVLFPSRLRFLNIHTFTSVFSSGRSCLFWHSLLLAVSFRLGAGRGSYIA
jgi:hypothetical protein